MNTTIAAMWPRRLAKLTACIFVLAASICAVSPAAAQFAQQGPKLVGTGASGTCPNTDTAPPCPMQGTSVALSANGNIALIGGPDDNQQGNNGVGAAWIFTRSGGVWTQDGSKLVGTGVSGLQGAFQGTSVALSADGGTAIIGGPGDNGFAGAAWVFTPIGGVWTQQGSKLAGSDASGGAHQGQSVALSADGNTAVIGGWEDSSDAGAAWVFTRSGGGAWSQQGLKLVGSGAAGAAQQGWSVAVSADGNTAIVGGPADNSSAGAAWVFTRSGGAWSQQGSKLVGNGAVFNEYDVQQGFSVALSADGNTAMVGGPGDNSDVGAVWVFTRSDGLWAQQGPKLFANGGSEQGHSVALSADGNTAVIGSPDAPGAYVWTRNSNGVWTQQESLAGSGGLGPGGEVEQGYSVAVSADASTAILGGPLDLPNFEVPQDQASGAAWVFVRTFPTSSHDFDDDGVSDILWRDTSGNLAMWLMSAGHFSSGANIGQVPGAWSVVGTRDFNGDGHADILWLDTSGDLAVWLMNGTTLSSGINLGNVGTQWFVAGTSDFNADGTGDILWRNSSSGDTAIWLMNNGQLASGIDLGVVPPVWQVVGTGDFNGDGTTDILWRNQSTGDLAIWFLQNGQLSSGADLGAVPLTWSVVGTGDFDGDGVTDILWRDSSGNLAIWLMSNGQLSSGVNLGNVPTTWSVAQTGDFDGDGKSDILWLDNAGDLAVWLMNGVSVSSRNGLGNVGTSWTVQGQNAD